MIRMTIDVQTRPQKNSEFLHTLEGLLEIFRKEKGNISYQYQLDAYDSNKIHIKTQWENWYNLEDHFQSKFFHTLFGAIRVLCEKPEVMIDDHSTLKNRKTLN